MAQPKIAFITLADLPLPAVKGGAVETLIDIICDRNELENRLSIDVYSIEGAEKAVEEKKVNYFYYKKIRESKVSFKNILYKTTGQVILNKTMSSIVRQINKKEYDFVIVTSIIKEIACFAKACNSPVIWYLHGDAVEVLGKEWVYRITQECAGVITVSNFVGRQVRETGTTKPVHVVKNCSDITPIKQQDEAATREMFRALYGIGNETVFAYVGRIVPIKGVLELVQAFGKAERTDAKLLVVGKPDPGYENYFAGIQKAAGNNVIFTGYVSHNELNQVYCAVDAVVVPSVCNEAASLAVVEAQRCGKYVIAADRGGICEYAVPEMTDMVDDKDSTFVKNLSTAINRFYAEKNEKKFRNSIKFTPEEFYIDFCDTVFELLKTVQ